MNLESQACTLEQAKRLEELGVCDSSLFFWALWSDDSDENEWNLYYGDNREYGYLDKVKEYNAYTSAELGEMITKLYPCWSYTRRGDLNLYVIYKNIKFPPCSLIRKEYYGVPDTHARAEFLIYLLENKNV